MKFCMRPLFTKKLGFHPLQFLGGPFPRISDFLVDKGGYFQKLAYGSETLYEALCPSKGGSLKLFRGWNHNNFVNYGHICYNKRKYGDFAGSQED